ncbi:sirohydrochlorin cobaltochelatase [Oxalobacteraceae bacterium GrIS 2.11]
MSNISKEVRALILFAHGARDPRWAEPLGRIQQLIRARVDSSVQVHQSFLELMSPSLPDLVAELVAQDIFTITVIPVFLGQGSHVRQDLPKLIEQLRLSHPQLQLGLATAIGENEQVLDAIATVCIANL